MSRISTTYDNTIIYKICCKNTEITEEYIGHTKNIIRRRWEHKSHCNNEKSKQFNLKLYQCIRENGGWNNWVMIQIEAYPCKDVNEARARERYHIELLKPALNCDIPNRTTKEYREDKKEELVIKSKEYREDNAEQIAIKKKEYAEQNKEKISIKKKKYYEEHKDIILEKIKEYAKQNADIIAVRNKKWREDNAEIIAIKKNEYRADNKDILNEKAKERIRCECCNCDVPRRHISTHNKTKKHQEHVNKITPIIVE